MSSVSKFKHLFPLILVLLLAVLLRLVFFNQSPPSLNWDEASLGYNAFSILQTGRDEWGKTMPLTFEAFGDYKLPGYIYVAVPFIALFDLNEFSIRLPSIIAGILSVLFLYLIILEISKNKTWATASSLLLALSPMAVFLSRIALEANLALAFFIAGVFCLLISKKSTNFLTAAGILFGLTLFTYNSARVFIPLFLVTLFIFKFKKLKVMGRKILLPAAIFLIFASLAGYLALTQDSASRYYWVAIVDEGAINSINQSRGDSTYGPVLTKLIFNRYTYFTSHLITNYFSHFSPSFLFFEGGSNYQFSVPKTGLLYLIELPFLLFGIFKLRNNRTWALLFLSWVLLSPIPASITRESPNVLRSIFLLGGLQAIVGYGFAEALRDMKGRLKSSGPVFAILIATLLFIQAGIYFKIYFFEYPRKYSQSWQYGYKQIFQFVSEKENISNRPLYITKRYGEPHIFYLFYSKYNPATYQTNPDLTRYSKSNWRWVDRIDNIYFVNDWEVKDKLKDEHGYVISTEKNYPGIPTIFETVKFLDGSVAFEVVEI